MVVQENLKVEVVTVGCYNSEVSDQVQCYKGQNGSYFD